MIPDAVIIVLDVVSLADFLLCTYPHLKAEEIAPEESVWERLAVDL